jgi:hypothetical protein
VAPELALAPEIPPVIAPMVQLKLLAAVAVRDIFGLAPLQIVAVAALVITGIGFTVTVMVKAAPAQVPEEEVGVIMYGTVPAAALLGLVRV